MTATAAAKQQPPAPPPPPRTVHDLLTALEVAGRLRVDVATVRRWTRTGELRGYRVGSAYRYSEQQLEAFLEAGSR